MQGFAELFHDLDGMTKTGDRIGCMTKYFREADSKDAGWAAWFLAGNRIKGAVRTGELRELAASRLGLPLWLLEESYERVGDLAETLSLLIRGNPDAQAISLSEVVEEILFPLGTADPMQRQEILVETWSKLRSIDLLPFHKLLTGGFRIGVSRGNLCRALAEVAGVDPAVISQRISGEWDPREKTFDRIVGEEREEDGWCRPFPFCLASPLQEKPEALGDPKDWWAEWKWDGVRCQLLSEENHGLLWTRGEESTGESFPELLEMIPHLPAGLVIDGEILAWGPEGLRSFNRLQKRLGRKEPGPSLVKKEPVQFMAYDLLRKERKDLRKLPFQVRRKMLQDLVTALPQGFPIRLSPPVPGATWVAWGQSREESRQRGVEGLMLKHKDSVYSSGRVKGDWYKWKIDPFVADMVVVGAQLGHGKRANLYSDYTLAVLDGKGEFVTVAKAYSGITDEELREIDRYVRKNITGKFGPVRGVRPGIVFEVAFEGVRASGRHKSGIALRFPRIQRWRKDKDPKEVDTLENLLGYARMGEPNHGEGPRSDDAGNLLLF
ncbi:MAG: ATP-dependent DNA ligase [Opitutae bacterium]